MNNLPNIVARQFIGLVNAFGVPIGPKERILKDGNGERMRQSSFHHFSPTGSVQSDALDDVMLGVGPVDVIHRVVDGESIGPDEILRHQDLSMRSVQIGSFDARLMAPVSPHDGDGARMDGDGSRLLHILPDECAAHASVQLAHFNPAHSRIGPVQVVMDPIDGHSAWALESPPDGVRNGGAIEMGSFNGVQSDVRPDDESLTEVEIECDGVLQSIDDGSVFLLEERHLSNIDAIGKDQTDRLAQGFARRLVRSQDVSVDATTTESAHRIGAQLTAVRLSDAFVHIDAIDSVVGQSVSAPASARRRSVGQDEASVLASTSGIALFLDGAIEFVFSAGTIAFAVADVAETDARIVRTGELILAAVICWTILLVLAIRAIRFSIAQLVIYSCVI